MIKKILIGTLCLSTLMNVAVAQTQNTTPAASGSVLPTESTSSDWAHKSESRKVMNHYVKLVHEVYSDLNKSVSQLKSDIKLFTENPNSAQLEIAKLSWKKARIIYSLSESFRFYGGPIDEAKNGVEGLVNTWPIDESYLDYVKGSPTSGIIQNTKLYPEINSSLLLEMNEKGGEKNISTGFHAIEFLLWGQDFNLQSPGNRPVSDYLATLNPIAKRRAAALNALADLLETHLLPLEKQWDSLNESSFATQFLKLPEQQGIQKILTGMAMLSMDEMAGERMTVALIKRDTENEQDCFSDFSIQDLTANMQGILNIWTGQYGALSGPGVSTLAKSLDATFTNRTELALNQSLTKLTDLKAPFDFIIQSPKKSPLQKQAFDVINSLENQAKMLSKIARLSGVRINVSEK